MEQRERYATLEIRIFTILCRAIWQIIKLFGFTGTIKLANNEEVNLKIRFKPKQDALSGAGVACYRRNHRQAHLAEPEFDGVLVILNAAKFRGQLVG